ncbi:unnamed protein product, partial [Pelagomonas calceolata]
RDEAAALGQRHAELPGVEHHPRRGRRRAVVVGRVADEGHARGGQVRAELVPPPRVRRQGHLRARDAPVAARRERADARRRRLGARAADAHAEAVARRERVVDREGPSHDARDDAEVRLPRRPVLEGAARRRRRPRVQGSQQEARGAVVEAVAIFDRRVGKPRARQRIHRHTIVQAVHPHVRRLAQHRVVLCPKQHARRAGLDRCGCAAPRHRTTLRP